MPDSPRLSRRSTVGLLGAGLGAAAVSACDPGKDIGASADPSPTRTADYLSPSASPDDDAALVTSVVDQLNQAFGVLVIARKFATLRPTLTSLLKAHREHVEALGEKVGGWVGPTYADATAALAGVRQSERALQAGLVDAAGKAESGALARLLASASASVSQHLATLPSGRAA